MYRAAAAACGPSRRERPRGARPGLIIIMIIIIYMITIIIIIISSSIVISIVSSVAGSAARFQRF